VVDESAHGGGLGPERTVEGGATDPVEYDYHLLVLSTLVQRRSAVNTARPYGSPRVLGGQNMRDTRVDAYDALVLAYRVRYGTHTRCAREDARVEVAMIPELSGPAGSVRIPELRNVPLTPRIVRLVDHPAFQRLRRVRQLGPTHLVYPGAVHTRFEHSLGVFDMARHYVSALLRHPEVRESLTQADIEACLLAGLLHDIGHYPFAHSLEALHHGGADTPRHESLAEDILFGRVGAAGEQSMASIIDAEFDVRAEEVAALISGDTRKEARPERRLVGSIVSSGVDADKADYLERDSIHMGVSYGRNYDRARFLDSLCPSVAGDRIAVTEKGRVSAEIFIFCRYTMFSEAYWHHAVRSISAMIEHALWDFQGRAQLDHATLTALLLSKSDDELVRELVERSPPTSITHQMLSAMMDGRRSFYKRVLTLSRAVDDVSHQTAYERIYALDRADTERLREVLCGRLARALDITVGLSEVIIDTPPRDKDRVETVEVVYRSAGRVRGVPLEQVSKVVQGIGTDFVKVVKKIRVFVSPRVRARVDALGLRDRVMDALMDTVLGFQPSDELQQGLGF